MAEAHNDATLFLDELAQVDPSEAVRAAYMLANGQGKGRMTKTLGAAKKIKWKLIFASSGELTLAEHAATAGKRIRGGGEVRILNIDADAGKGMGIFEDLHEFAAPDALADELKRRALKYYGEPFRAFLRLLVVLDEETKQFVREIQTRFAREYVPPDATGEVKRAANRFALIAAAGELATTEYELTGWRVDEAFEAAGRLFEEWLRQRGTRGSSDAEAGVRQVRHFIEANGESRFQAIRGEGAEETEPIRERAGFRRRNAEGEIEYLILPEVFRTEVCAGYSYRDVLKALGQREYLARDETHYTIKPRLPGQGTVRVYCVRATILEAEE
jgi:putative DNA primase/helicase